MGVRLAGRVPHAAQRRAVIKASPELQERERTKFAAVTGALADAYSGYFHGVRRGGHGTTYPDLPWEPKQAFGAVASFYATHTPSVSPRCRRS